MNDTQEKPSSGTEQPGNSVEATSSTQDKCSHGECVQVGDTEDKVILFDPPGYSADVLPHHLGCKGSKRT